MKLRSRIVAFLLIVVALFAAMGTTVSGVLKDINLGLDLQGGFEVLYEVQPLDEKNGKVTAEDVQATADAISRRVNVLGVSEPSIQIEGDNRIRVQLAGVKDQDQARDVLSNQANLTFRDVDDKELLNGNDLKQGGAKAAFDQNGAPMVTLKLKDAQKFADITSKLSQRPQGENLLVIWLDFAKGDSYAKEMQKENPAYASAASVRETLNTSDVQITGNFTVEETKNLAGILNAGALPAKLVEVYSTSVGAQFGDNALKATVFASIIGVAAIFVFMLLVYRLPGLIAVITLTVFTYIVLWIFEMINAVLTLPGIAALVLGIGMAVDANILMYERIKEELRIGRPIKAAFHAGSKSSFTAIFDANITTLLAAAVLFYFGTSSVKGFATTLIISIVVTFLTAVWGTRILLGLLVKSGYLDNKPGLFGVNKKRVHKLSEGIETLDLKTHFDRFDFVHNRKKFFALSAILILAGMIVLGIFRLNLGIDFTAGSRVEIHTSQSLKSDEVEKVVEKEGLTPKDISIAGDKSETAVLRFEKDFTKDEVKEFRAHMQKTYGDDTEVAISTVSPTIGKELAKNAIKALIYAAIGIIIYVAVRFEWRMGVATIISLLHDVFFMVAIFSMFRIEVDITFIAAVLTIVGYSINDTIVTFDRIRENLHRVGIIKDKEELANIVNKSLRQTLGRSVNTVVTVLVVVIALMIFGATSIQTFALALLIGLVTGVYSSIYIAAQIWYVLKVRQMKKKGGKVDVSKKERKWGSDEPVV
ncbi:protein translocase subunit SecDF [Kurthia massiliensis]|uniref:protein translocase subunit SecDF n=1 Tax=Kurthia massiliensis TaxID=1033739 RepID=UPI000288747A|nr:protein translocase subunit SecDF [Kurthia massiliensis]